MHYLTTQDIIWIHLQIAKKPGTFNFAKLEEVTGYQYAYGKSKDVLGQASRFIPGFVSKGPFESANKAVALVSGILFLELNGLHFGTNDKDLMGWFEQASSPATSKAAVEGYTSVAHDDHHATTKDLALSVISRYEATIKKLLD
jgi:prophage maintenance system killer protein